MIDCACRKTHFESTTLHLFQALLDISTSNETALAAKAEQVARHAVARRAKVESLSEADYQEATTLLKLIHGKALSKKAAQALSILTILQTYLANLATASERLQKDWIQFAKDSFKDFATRKASQIPVAFLANLLKGNINQAWQLRNYLLARAASDSAKQYRQIELTKMISSLLQAVYSRTDLRELLIYALPSMSDSFLQIFRQVLASESVALKRLKDLSQAAATVIRIHSKLDVDSLETLWLQPLRVLFEGRREAPAVLRTLMNKTNPQQQSQNESKRKRQLDNSQDTNHATKKSKSS